MRIEFLKSCRRPQPRRRETLVVASAINPTARPPRPSPSTSSPPLPGSAPLGFSAPDASHFRLAVLGDLHYDPRDEPVFTKAQEQLARVLRERAEEANENEAKGGNPPKTVSRLVQLGDLGASSFAPGTPPCFEHARAFLGAAAVEAESFGAPPALVAGTHGEFFKFTFFFFFPSVSLLLSRSLFFPRIFL